MTEDTPTRVTHLLHQIGDGDRAAVDDLLPMIYGELRRLARARLRGQRPGNAPAPTSLVHEAYVRLVGDRELHFANRTHFFAAAGEAMRHILVDQARRRARVKHGGDRIRVTLDDEAAGSEPPSEEILAIDQALGRLEEQNGEMARIVKLRYFAGLTVAETARALDLSERTVHRQWSAARAWLHAELSGDSRN